LAAKIAALILATGWTRSQVLVAGGLAQSDQLVEELARLLPGTRLEPVPESGFLEALGAAVSARQAGHQPLPAPDSWVKSSDGGGAFQRRRSLSEYCDRVLQVRDPVLITPQAGMRFILGVDAGSTTTKAILLDCASGRLVASCYLRTHGNPVQATFECIAGLARQVDAIHHRVVQAAVTGSGREIVSVYLDNCLVFNEILAHARAARALLPEVDTLFEIGGQDSKFVALQSGIPVDYSMNDGCSAGTGSFLEEAAASDMQISMEQLGPLALSSTHPVAFGERCAAFINSEVRSALQQGVPRADVVAGLIYAVVENYLSRVVGARQIGRRVILQGGVALNSAVAPAVAALTDARVAIPPKPELMGCEGAARMALDLLSAGAVPACDRQIGSFGKTPMEVKPPFTCRVCENRCDVQRILLGGKTLAFGGLCSKWGMVRRPKALRHAEGRDLVALRHELMFQTFAPAAPPFPRGRIGLPLALTTYELYPLYARFLNGLGFEVVLSRRGSGSRRTAAPMCYPAELMHAAVDDLLAQEVDYVFLPYMREFPPVPGDGHGYVCPITQDLAGVIAAFFDKAAGRMLTPEIGLAPWLAKVTEQQIVRVGRTLGVSGDHAIESWSAAKVHQAAFEGSYRSAVEEALRTIAWL
jgi:predicted CoA-substrate-specific enzyme activase